MRTNWLERSAQCDADASRLDRMEVDVFDAGDRLAHQARPVVVVDVAGLAVEQVEDIERDLDARRDLVADAQVGEGGRFRAHRAVFDQRARAEAAHLELAEPRPEVGYRRADRNHPSDRTRDAI